jgi:ribosomal protein S18 acetylase RimI-like enzyme
LSAPLEQSLTIQEPISLADAAAIADLYPAKTADEKRQMVERHLGPDFEASRAGRRTILLAKRDNVLVGTVQVVWEDGAEEPGLLPPGSAVIHHLRTHPDLRRMGIARRLLTAAERLATHRGLEHLTLGVEPANEAARRLYERFGFQNYLTYLGSDGEPLLGMKKPLTATVR